MLSYHELRLLRYWNATTMFWLQPKLARLKVLPKYLPVCQLSEASQGTGVHIRDCKLTTYWFFCFYCIPCRKGKCLKSSGMKLLCWLRRFHYFPVYWRSCCLTELSHIKRLWCLVSILAWQSVWNTLEKFCSYYPLLQRVFSVVVHKREM